MPLGFFDFLRRFWQGWKMASGPPTGLPPLPPTAPPAREQSPAPAQPSLPAPSGFLPISREELHEQAKDVRRGGAWFGRRDLIPPADDPRTKLIDRALVTQGLLSPDQLTEIHTVGEQMDRIVRRNEAISQQASRSGQAAVEADRTRRAEIKRQKKEESARRKQERAAAVAERRANDIVFVGRGVSGRMNDRTSDTARLQAAGLPVLSTPKELAEGLGITIGQLRWLCFHTEVATRIHYVHFEVPKRSGGTRVLSAPHRKLRAAQGWVLEHILAKLPTEPTAHGFIARRSILTNAQQHVGRKVVINLDLEGFFPNITFPRVRSVFARLGYSGAVATLLALLCTECPRRAVEYAGVRYFVAAGPRGLPQGACTSPALSNQVARRLDRRLMGLARKLQLTYTRYADDLTFSAATGTAPEISPTGPPAASSAEGAAAGAALDLDKQPGYLLARVRHIADDEGFAVNAKKTRVLRRNTAQTVTGLIVNDKPGIRRREIRRLRAILHRAQRDGLDAQNRDGRPHFRAWLRGKIAYVRMSRPDVGEKLLAAYRAVSAGR